ncbi:MAG: GTP-dependent dephospho-CoA kinase family protein [Candidatus Micrarchaeota archaeon]|nr:GTP-dependent dephospho-CoA kinase family protein [Candidatus Micrarchaeota archaeon]
MRKCKVRFRLNKKLRGTLARPLGNVFSEEETLSFLRDKRRNKKYKLIAVGDATGLFLSKNGFIPDLWIYDGKIMRKKISWKLPFPTYVVTNPRSLISSELCDAIDDALRSNKTERILVIGEEDLATIYVLYRAKRAFILYGQPGKGIVIIKSDRKTRNMAESFLRQME